MFEFMDCDGGRGDNAQLSSIPLGVDLRDVRVVPARLRPLPEYSACVARGNLLSIALGGRRRGSGSGILLAHGTYAFSWPIRAVVHRTLPWRPRTLPASAGEAVADLLFGGEPASPTAMLANYDRWTITAMRGLHRLFTTTVGTTFDARTMSGDEVGHMTAASQMRLEVRDLTPVYILPSAPTHLLLKKATESVTSPKFSTFPNVLPILNVWRAFTFVWEAGDAGGGNGDAPVLGALTAKVLGRHAGVRKIDEVAWKGFQLISSD